MHPPPPAYTYIVKSQVSSQLSGQSHAHAVDQGKLPQNERADVQANSLNGHHIFLLFAAQLRLELLLMSGEKSITVRVE